MQNRVKRSIRPDSTARLMHLLSRPIFQVGVSGLLSGVVTFTIYWLTLAPTISWQHGGADSGELAAAVATLGIPHPPGYPTYVLLGWVWSWVPVGHDLAYRLNVLSAASGALTTGMCTLTIFTLSTQRSDIHPAPRVIGAIFGGVLVGLAPLTWSQAIITEVYAPGLALLALFTLGLCYWWYHPSHKLAGGLGLLAGLSMGVLPQFALASLGTILVIACRLKPRQILATIATMGSGALLGLSTFAYLPLRATTQPFLNWGNPSNGARFWAHVTAADYQQYFGLVSNSTRLERVGTSLLELGQQLGWSGLGLALLGAYFLFGTTSRALLGYFVSLMGFTLLFRASYPVSANIVYLLPVIYSLAILSGLGLERLLIYAHTQIGGWASVIGLILIASVGVRTMQALPQLNLSDDYAAAQFGQTTLAKLPKNAIIISEQDATTFALWYYQAIDQRRDVVVLDARLIHFDWYQHHLHHMYPNLDNLDTFDFNQQNFNRPTYIISPETYVIQPAFTLE